MQKKYTFFNKMKKGGRCMNKSTSLKRSLGVWLIFSLVLGYMNIKVVFDIFGIVSTITIWLVPLSYVTSLLVLILTAIRYGKMVQVFPDASLAYTYTLKTMGNHLGFFVGWASLLDY